MGAGPFGSEPVTVMPTVVPFAAPSRILPVGALLEIVGGASVTPTVKVSALLSEPSCARTVRVCAPPLVSKSMRLPFATVSAPVAELTANPPPELSPVSVKLSSGDIQLPHDRPGKSTVPVALPSRTTGFKIVLKSSERALRPSWTP